MSKVLYISYDGMTDPLGQSQVIPYLKGLSEHGFSFHLISCEKKKKFIEQNENIKRILDEANIKWHPLVYTKTPPILSTLFDILKIRRKAFSLHRKENFSLVHCRSYIPSLIGLSMKKKFHIKFIFDMRGFWADERVDGHLWNLKNPLYKTIYDYFKRKEKEFLIRADYTISLTESGKKEIEKWKLTNTPLPIAVIPCCVDMDLFSPEKVKDEIKKQFINKLNISEKDFVISYLGAIGTWYMLSEMLLFFKVLLSSNPNAKFLFITQEDSQEIFSGAKKTGIPLERIIIQNASRSEVPVLLSISNVSLFFITPAYSKKASSPTKMGEIMAMGIPSVTNKGIGDVDTIINKTSSGIILDDFSEMEFQHAINFIEESKWESTKLRQTAIDNFSLDEGVNKYNKIYKDCLGNTA